MIILRLQMRYSNTNCNDKYGKDQRSCSLIMGTYLIIKGAFYTRISKTNLFDNRKVFFRLFNRNIKMRIYRRFLSIPSP
jgi:hypothetical protein